MPSQSEERAPPETKQRWAKSFQDLECYQAAFGLAVEIFSITHYWPAEERFALTDQIRRSSRSVATNIAEAWRKRLYPRHFRSKLSDAFSEAAETESWLEFARASGYINETDYGRLNDRAQHIGAMINKMMRNWKSWCQ